MSTAPAASAYPVPQPLMHTSATNSAASGLPASPVFTPALAAQFGIDKVSATTYSPSLHPGLHSSLLAPEAALASAQALIARDSGAHLRLRRTSARGNHYVQIERDLVTHRHLVGPTSYALLSTFSACRRLRRVLCGAQALADYDPPLASPLGNVVHPDGLIDIAAADLPGICQAEAAKTILTLPQTFAQNAMTIFGVREPRRIEISLTGVEIAWDMASADPEGLIRSYARAVSANLMPRPRPAAQTLAKPPATTAPIYMLVGHSPRFKLVIYPKLSAGAGRRGMARFEFRFAKAAIKKILRTTVLPSDERGIVAAFAKLADHAWPCLLALEADRMALPRQIEQPELLDALGGFRNQGAVREVLDILAADAKIRLTSRNRRIVTRLETRGWLRPLLFRRPAYRKLAPGFDLALWRRGRVGVSAPVLEEVRLP